MGEKGLTAWKPARGPDLRTGGKMRSAGRVAAAICLAGGLAAMAASGPARAYSKSSITIDGRTGLVLQAHNADATHPPASLSKLMTLYLTFEALARGRFGWNTRVRISRHAATRPPSKLYLRRGQRIRVRDLVYATAIKSANDAAAALADKIAGSERRFARLMTQRARQLGMRRTVFGTASGLPARGQRTTARDMAILARSLIHHYPQYTKVFGTRYYRYGRRGFRNTNRLLRSNPHVKGMKTGYTRRARYNLVTNAHNGNIHLITVVLGARTSNHRYWKTRRLLANGWRTAHNSAYLRRTPKGYVRIATRSQVGGNPVRAKTRAPRTAHASAAAKTGKSKVVTALPKKRPNDRRIRLSLASSAMAAPRRAAAGKPAARRRHVHGVQVGAFYRRTQARSAIRRAMRALPNKLPAPGKLLDRPKERPQAVHLCCPPDGFRFSAVAAGLPVREAAGHGLRAGLRQGCRRRAETARCCRAQRRAEVAVCHPGRRIHQIQPGATRLAPGQKGSAQPPCPGDEHPYQLETQPGEPGDLPGPDYRPVIQRGAGSLQYSEAAQPQLHGGQASGARLSRLSQSRRCRRSSAGVTRAIAAFAFFRNAGSH